jgi:hypothetical protein
MHFSSPRAGERDVVHVPAFALVHGTTHARDFAAAVIRRRRARTLAEDADGVRLNDDGFVETAGGERGEYCEKKKRAFRHCALHPVFATQRLRVRPPHDRVT